MIKISFKKEKKLERREQIHTALISEGGNNKNGEV